MITSLKDESIKTGFSSNSSSRSPGVYTLATWRLRVKAHVFDVLFPNIAIISLNDAFKGDQSILQILSLLFIAFSVWNLYRLGETGQSIGKQVAGIALVSEEDAKPLGWRLTLLRSILHIVDVATLFYGYFRPIWDPKAQTFADSIVKSVVVSGVSNEDSIKKRGSCDGGTK